MKTIKAKPLSYSKQTRSRKSVLFIVIHYTSNKGDTAVNNGMYFARSNKTPAGAHFFIDRKGEVVKSVSLNRSAWSVGGSKYPTCNKTGGGKYFGKCKNDNSVSIELCDIVDKYPSEEQIIATKKTIKYIRRYCPNAKTVIRHFDVTGKSCPASMVEERVWKRFLQEIGE